MQMASVKSANKLQKRIARYVDERLGFILRELNQFDNLLGTKTIERNLLEKKLFGLRMQGGNVQGASIHCIVLMKPKCFKDKSGSSVLQWLDYMKRYLTADQVIGEEKNSICLDLLRTASGPIFANSCQKF